MLKWPMFRSPPECMPLHTHIQWRRGLEAFVSTACKDHKGSPVNKRPLSFSEILLPYTKFDTENIAPGSSCRTHTVP